MYLCDGFSAKGVIMRTYVISDIHGEYEQFLSLLEQIDLKEEDSLYVLGDVLDRGEHPIRVLQYLMNMPNAYCIAGNHELMALENMKVLLHEITDEFLDTLNDEAYGKLVDWIYNGAKTTIKEFYSLGKEERNDVLDFLGEFSAYEEVEVNGQAYILVHAGFQNFSRSRAIEDYSIDELVWERPDYEVPYFNDIIVVTGHTPTQSIEINPNPGYVFRANNHIAIDCGACFEGGRLAAICLETGEEYYSK